MTSNNKELMNDILFIINKECPGAVDQNNVITEAGHALKDVNKDNNKYIVDDTIVTKHCGDAGLKASGEDNSVKSVVTALEAQKLDKQPKIADNIKKTTKRDGTSGVSGQLYETKLLSLVFFRASTNDDISQFCLGANMNGIGDLDDLCIRYKQNDDDVIIFLQAKHKSDIEKRITKSDLYKEGGDFCLPKYFKSYLDIRQKFCAKNKDDIMFQAQYEDMKCYFILYTTAKDDLVDEKRVDNENDDEEIAMDTKRDTKNTNKQLLDKTVTDLICTGGDSDIFQYKYDDADIDLLSKTVLVKQLKLMGIKFLEIISEDNKNKNRIKSKRYENMMTDKDIRNFHIVLAQKVINVSEEVNDGHRTGSFREEFFFTDDELLIELRKALYSEALKNKKLRKAVINSFIQDILQDPSVDNISKLVGNVITYNTDINRLEITDRKIKGDPMFQKYFPRLQRVPVMEADAMMAFEIAGKKELDFEFKLPATFGNRDLKLPQNKEEKKLDNRTKAIVDMIRNSTDKHIIIDKKGGIEDAVGNLLVYDEDNKSLMFNRDDDSMGKNAKKIMASLKNCIHDLNTYRLSINVFGFPRVSFDTSEYERSFAKDFLNNLWFYTCQAKEDDVEKIAKKEMSDRHNASKQNQALFRVKAEAIFLKFHDEIQKWWMLKSTQAYYLTHNDVQIFDNILNYFVDSPLLSVLNFIYINKIKNTSIEFNVDAVKALSLDDGRTGPRIIETDVNILTSMKLVQYFNEHSNGKFLDLDYLLSLPHNNFDIAMEEIRSINDDTLIILYENTSNDQDLHKLEAIIKESDENKVILVTKRYIAIELQKVLPKYTFSTVRDLKINLTDLTYFALVRILNTTITFQGERVACDVVIDTAISRELINGEILSKIINKDYIQIGRGLLNAEYDEIKDFYVNRSVKIIRDTIPHGMPGPSGSTTFPSSFKKNRSSSYVGEEKKIILKSLMEGEDVVVVVGAAGMGKSTLLTHLSMETKKTNPNIWITRINLIDHKKQFLQWRQENVTIGIKETLRFLCKTAVSKNRSDDDFVISDQKIEFDVDFVDHKVVVKSIIANAINTLEFNIFIHSCNAGNVVVLIEGFDEIHAKDQREVLRMVGHIIAVTGQRVWITSRHADGINDLIENIQELFPSKLKTLYSLQPCTRDQEFFYYESFFEKNIIITELDDEQLKNVDSLFEHVDSVMEKGTGDQSLHAVHVAAVEYFKTEIGHVHLAADKIHYRKKWNAIKLVGEGFSNSGNPHHMHLLANYFQRKIKDHQSAGDDSKWDMSSLPILETEGGIVEARITENSGETEIVKQVQQLQLLTVHKTSIFDRSWENSSTGSGACGGHV